MITNDERSAAAEEFSVAEWATTRASKAQEQARRLAGRLADTTGDLAVTLDDVADTEEAHARRIGSDELLERAQRARDKAEAERREARRLRERSDRG
jgi:hypothetical protein